MKRDQKSINARHEQILDLLDRKQELKADEIASAFGISLMTVRRDLQALEDQGLLKRFHGGARRVKRENLKEELYVQRARDDISRYAAGLIQKMDSIFINGSMTASGVLEYLQVPDVTVITNNAFAAGYLTSKEIHIYLTGGNLRGHIMVGDFCLRNLLSSYATKAFLGCTGISDQGEILCDIPSELSINETMISHAQEYYILADYTKIGKTEASGSFTLPKSGTVITDSKANPKILERLREKGIRVIIAEEALQSGQVS